MGFLIVKNPTSTLMEERKRRVPGIIGSNILGHMSKSIVPGRCLDVMDPKEWQRWKHVLTLYEEAQVAKRGDGTWPAVVHAAGPGPHLIPARTAIRVEGTCCLAAEEFTVMISNSSYTLPALPSGLAVGHTCATVSCSGHVPLQVVNWSDQDRYLPPRMPVAWAEKVEVRPVGPGSTDAEVDQRSQGVPKETSSLNDLVERMDISPQINLKQRRDLIQLIGKHQEVFSRDEDDIGDCSTVTHHIRTTDDQPVRIPHRSVPPNQWGEVQDFMKSALDRGVIRESKSSYASPIVLVRKPSGKLRVCIDYRLLNRKTVKDAYPLPRIQDALQALRGAKYFGSIDLAHGFFQLRVAEDKPKTAFRPGTGGLYEFERMPMGLCNAPGTFMRLMDHIFGDQNFQTLLNYLDDILVFSTTFEEMLARLDMVLTRLQEHGLKVKPEKCSLGKEKIRYLGYTVSAVGVEPDEDKIRAIIVGTGITAQSSVETINSTPKS